MSSRTLDLLAHAKINLVLDLLGPRPDGYTEIATIFQTIDLADRIRVTLAEGPAEVLLEVDGDAPSAPEENLAGRAALAYLDATGTAAQVHLRLEKRVPAGAGLGGGSSDAAAVLRALDELCGASRSAGLLAEIGSALGADVPFFLEGGLALGTGRGDILEPLPDLPSTPLVLARSEPPLSTAAVYREARAALTPRVDAPNISRFLGHLRDRRASLPPVSNGLFEAASRLAPGIGRMVDRLAASGGHAAMTGSGSVVFALFSDERAAHDAVAAVLRECPEAWVCVSRTRPRDSRR